MDSGLGNFQEGHGGWARITADGLNNDLRHGLLMISLAAVLACPATATATAPASPRVCGTAVCFGRLGDK